MSWQPYTPEQIAYLNATEPADDQQAESEPEDGQHEECYGIHRDADGYRTCDGRAL